MKRTLFWCALAIVLMALGAPRAAWAKGETVKLTLSGGGLAKDIELTDPEILKTSHVWAGNFLDSSRGTVKEPPRGLPRYEVTFYVKLRDDEEAKKAYVVYYCPSQAAGQGYIYLPGKGDPEEKTNWGSMMRPGRDGKWNYAAGAWEELIKPVIARAEAAQRHGS